MKRFISVLTAMMLSALMLFSCGKSMQEKWQEQLDLGMRYLEELDYENAILAFTKAIEIDPRQTEPYVQRAGAYLSTGETDETLAAALADYEQVLELDETNENGYLGLADVYIRMGQYEKALELLQDALNTVPGSQAIADKLEDMENGIFADAAGRERRTVYYNADGVIESYHDNFYNILGQRTGWEIYTYLSEDGTRMDSPVLETVAEVEYGEDGLITAYYFYDAQGQMKWRDTFTYENGLKTEQHRYTPDGVLDCYFLFYYDDQDRQIRYEGYHAEGDMYGYWISEYDEAGNLIKETSYDADGNVNGYQLNE